MNILPVVSRCTQIVYKPIENFLICVYLSGMEASLSKTTHGDFQRFLQETLVLRCKNNPAYSLRAFARQIGIEPSFLSKLISGKRKATPAVIKKISLVLSLGPSELEDFLNGPKTELSPEQRYQNLAMDHFLVISDWYHYAILELTLVEGFQSSPAWISQALGINPIQARDALERLERLEMLQKDESGNYSNASGSNTTVGHEFTASAFKKLQKQILMQAIDALENVPFELRDQSSMTMAIDPSLIPEAKKRLKDFRRELCQFLEGESPKRKEVFQLSLSLFPITKINPKDEL